MHISQYLYGVSFKELVFFLMLDAIMFCYWGMAKPKKKSFFMSFRPVERKNTDTVCQKAEVHTFPADTGARLHFIYFDTVSNKHADVPRTHVKQTSRVC